MGGTDDNLRAGNVQKPAKQPNIQAHFSSGVGDPDITTRVALLRQLASEEIVEFGTEDTVGHELALFADLSRHFGAGDGLQDGSKGQRLNSTGLSSVSSCAHPAISR